MQCMFSLDVVERRDLVTDDAVYLFLGLAHNFRVLRHFEERPRQDGGGGLMPSDEHRHEVIPELRVSGILSPKVHEKAEHTRIGDLAGKTIHNADRTRARGGKSRAGLAEAVR